MNRDQPTSAGNTPGNRYKKTMIPGPLVHPQGTPSADAAKAPGVALTLPQTVGSYVLVEILGTGGMSMTYLGHREDAPTRQVAIKFPLADDPGTCERFREEIHLLRDLDHHGIVKILAGGQKDFVFEGNQQPRRKPWFAMEFIPGQSLRQRLTKEGRLSWTDAKRLLKDVLETLQYLHEKHICHRDVKPDNLIYDDERQRWMLVDFGIAKSLLSDVNLTMTTTQHDPGSWEYMSPEQQNGQKVDSRSDIYSLGKTIWEALIGEVPRVGTPYPGEMNMQVPAEVDALLRKMVAHTPEKRFQSPREVLEALEAQGQGREQRVESGQRRRRLFRRASMVVLPLLLLVAGWFIADFVCAQQARELYLEHRGSSTLTLRKLEQFANNHWFWGRQYTDAKLAELRPLAEKERQDMIGEQQKLLQEIAQQKQQGPYYLVRCRNFVKTYGEHFGETPEYLAIKAEEERFDQSEKIRMELSRAQEVVAESQQLEKEAKFKQALQLCQASQNNFVLKEAKLLLEKRERDLRDVYYVFQLKKIDGKLKTGDANSLLQAATEVQALEVAFGSNQETTRRLTEFDAKFWDLCAAEAAKASKQHQYEHARAHVQFYLDNTRYKAHTLQASALHKSIANGEDDHDWDRMKQSIDKNLAQNTHALAAEDTARYLNKYPRGRHAEEAKNWQPKIIASQVDYIAYQTDLELFTEQMRGFLEKHPTATDHAVRLKNRMSGLLHDTIRGAMADDSLSADAKRDRLKSVDSRCRWCSKDHGAYLTDLVQRANRCLEDAHPHYKGRYLYALQRPPRGCLGNARCSDDFSDQHTLCRDRRRRGFVQENERLLLDAGSARGRSLRQWRHGQL